MPPGRIAIFALGAAVGACAISYVAVRIKLALQDWNVGTVGLRELDTIIEDAELEEEDLPIFAVNRGLVGKVAHEVKARFGTPERTPANVEAVRRAAYTLLREWTGDSHRTAHIARDLPRIVELVFVPSQPEIEARRFAQSLPVQLRRWRYVSPLADFLLRR